MTRARGAQAGLTLVELMVAMVISGFAIAAALTLGYSVMNGYREHKRALRVERAARGSMEIVAGAIRSATPAVPQGDLEDLVGCTTEGPIHVDNSSTAPDRLRVIHATGGALSEIASGTFVTDATANDTIAVADVTGFRVGDQVVISDTTKGAIVRVTGVDAATNTLSVLKACAGGGDSYGVGSLVIRAQESEFFIQTTGGVPVLMMDPDGPGAAEAEPLAEGVEDMQIAIGVDRVGGDAIEENGAAGDDDDWVHNVGADSIVPALSSPWRALRVTIVARSIREFDDRDQSTRPAVEDRPAASAADPFRRRVLTTTVEIRNLQGSP